MKYLFRYNVILIREYFAVFSIYAEGTARGVAIARTSICKSRPRKIGRTGASSEDFACRTTVRFPASRMFHRGDFWNRYSPRFVVIPGVSPGGLASERASERADIYRRRVRDMRADFHLTVITCRAHETECLLGGNSGCKLMRVMAIIRTELRAFSRPGTRWNVMPPHKRRKKSDPEFLVHHRCCCCAKIHLHPTIWDFPYCLRWIMMGLVDRAR